MPQANSFLSDENDTWYVPIAPSRIELVCTPRNFGDSSQPTHVLPPAPLSLRPPPFPPSNESLVNRVEATSKIPTPTREQQNAAPIPAIRSQDADTPVTVAEVEKQVASKKSEVVTEKRPAAPLTPAGGGGSGQAYDGAVSTGSAALQVVEGLAVLAIVPAVLAAREFRCLFRRGKGGGCLPVFFIVIGVFCGYLEIVWNEVSGGL